MHPRAPAWKSRRGIHHSPSVTRHDPHNGGAGDALPATQAGSDGFHATPLRGEPAQSSMTESGWMSIRAPVSFAARRAFWPSLPIARLSW